ncbi:MAG TPA: hypothetical protein VIH99_08030 [Bdellovibrionota bacterium]
MKYRMYCSQIKIGATFLLALSLSACAYTQPSSDRSPDSVQEDEGGTITNHVPPSKFDGREPASMKGDFTWLNEVEDEFGRVAAETSSRAVASQNKHEVLLKQKDWSFSYLPKTNHFYVSLQGTQYQMVQTKIDDGERFAFAAEGQAENPLTFAVTRAEGRNVASGESCDAEISYWSKNSKAYVTEKKALAGKSCVRMMGLLKDYVP